MGGTPLILRLGNIAALTSSTPQISESYLVDTAFPEYTAHHSHQTPGEAPAPERFETSAPSGKNPDAYPDCFSKSLEPIVAEVQHIKIECCRCIGATWSPLHRSSWSTFGCLDE